MRVSCGPARAAYGGLAETLVKAAVGNGLGITVDEDIDMGQLFEPAYGTFVIELAAGEDAQSVVTRLKMPGSTPTWMWWHSVR